MKQPLDKSLRNELERSVKKARTVAEAAVAAALDQLGVGEASAFDHLSDAEKDLRRRLRTHGRQLGDIRKPNAEQETIRLREEIAYEQWHRMLFARFLAENGLLMYDGVSVTLDECEELAEDPDVAEEWQLQSVNGQPSLWELAAKLAAAMLPQIFRTDSPAFELLLPPEKSQELEKILVDLDTEMFTASDSLGWVYQFWQAKRKDEVNASEVKIGARELPAVTQLFTEPYMVSFLLDNALGAWWAGKRLSDSDWQTATSEAQLRAKAAIDGVPLEYLRFVQDENGRWAPASGFFEKWPESLAELKMLDPSSGSGHFLVSVLQMLVPLRMEMENLSAKDAIDAVLRDNLHGLELDSRCVELAAFAVALAAWTFPGAEGYRPLPEMNIACSGLAVSVAKDEWKELALGKQNLRIALDWMYDTFKDAPVLGSLINPARSDASKIVEWDELSALLQEALEQEEGEEQHEVGVVAQGLAKAAMMLADKYHWVVTNVPYLGSNAHCDTLADFCEKYYPAAKKDLATVFLDRCIEMSYEGGTSSIVLPQNWLFLGSYKKFREKLLKNDVWHSVARLGAGAFETISGEVVKAILITISKGDKNARGGLFGDGATNYIRGIDVSAPKTAAEKAELLIADEVKSVEQAKQLDNPDARIVFATTESFDSFSNYVDVAQGISPGDTAQLRCCYWETTDYLDWQYLHSSPSATQYYTGMNSIIKRPDQTFFDKFNGFRLCGEKYWGRTGLSISKMRNLPVGFYTGTPFDANAPILVPKDETFFAPIYAYCSSESYVENVRALDQKLDVAVAALDKVPFDLDHWQKVAEEQYPHGLPKPYTNDPTQWIFHGHPCGSVVWDEETKWTASASLRTDDTVLQVAVARLLGYQWPAELDSEMELAAEQRALVEQCAELLPLADEDGIVCIPSVRGEGAAADRLLDMLAAAYGDSWNNSILDELLSVVGFGGKKLEVWLRDKFFTQHCKMFGNRPFIWQIWDGLKDGFSVLVNYHKFDAKLLETLIYTYLGDWIKRQTDDVSKGVDGAQQKLEAAQQLKKKLELIAEGESPYDIFVRWKKLEEQPIGWNPDLNDGVRLNVRPFIMVGDISKKGAGILRDKFNVKWAKDRGKDVESAPWYHLGPDYDGKEGDRINEHHLTLAEKKAARGEN